MFQRNCKRKDVYPAKELSGDADTHYWPITDTFPLLKMTCISGQALCMKPISWVFVRLPFSVLFVYLIFRQNQYQKTCKPSDSISPLHVIPLFDFCSFFACNPSLWLLFVFFFFFLLLFGCCWFFFWGGGVACNPSLWLFSCFFVVVCFLVCLFVFACNPSLWLLFV